MFLIFARTQAFNDRIIRGCTRVVSKFAILTRTLEIARTYNLMMLVVCELHQLVKHYAITLNLAAFSWESALNKEVLIMNLQTHYVAFK